MKSPSASALSLVIWALLVQWSWALYLPVPERPQPSGINGSLEARGDIKAPTPRGGKSPRMQRTVTLITDIWMNDKVLAPTFDQGFAYRAHSFLVFGATAQDGEMAVGLFSRENFLGESIWDLTAIDYSQVEIGTVLKEPTPTGARRVPMTLQTKTGIRNFELMDPKTGEGILFDIWSKDPEVRIGRPQPKRTNDGNVFVAKILRHPMIFGTDRWTTLPGRRSFDFMIYDGILYSHLTPVLELRKVRKFDYLALRPAGNYPMHNSFRMVETPEPEPTESGPDPMESDPEPRNPWTLVPHKLTDPETGAISFHESESSSQGSGTNGALTLADGLPPSFLEHEVDIGDNDFLPPAPAPANVIQSGFVPTLGSLGHELGNTVTTPFKD